MKKISICGSATEAGQQAAALAERVMADVIRRQGCCRVVFAAGNSQRDLLAALRQSQTIAWSAVTGFHLDEYLGLPADHPASFQRFLRARLVDSVAFADFHFIDGMAVDIAAECRRMGELVSKAPIDVALVGIGENGHLAFNDPPADFLVEVPYLVVELDEACRQQQVSEGWFPHLTAVPHRAITMSIAQIMAARTIICTAPERRKATAVAAALNGPITPRVPASILQTHRDVTFLLDQDSARGLDVNSWIQRG